MARIGQVLDYLDPGGRADAANSSSFQFADQTPSPSSPSTPPPPASPPPPEAEQPEDDVVEAVPPPPPWHLPPDPNGDRPPSPPLDEQEPAGSSVALFREVSVPMGGPSPTDSPAGSGLAASPSLPQPSQHSPL